MIWLVNTLSLNSFSNLNFSNYGPVSEIIERSLGYYWNNFTWCYAMMHIAHLTHVFSYSTVCLGLPTKISLVVYYHGDWGYSTLETASLGTFVVHGQSTSGTSQRGTRQVSDTLLECETMVGLGYTLVHLHGGGPDILY